MDARLLFPSDWICAADLRGQDAVVTISKVSLEELRMEDNSKERKCVIEFQGKKKKLVLNKTNMKMIGKVLKSFETDDWVGKQVALYPTTCKAFGEIVDCIRVRPNAPRKNGKDTPLEQDSPPEAA
jgi:hypothetical protein